MIPRGRFYGVVFLLLGLLCSAAIAQQQVTKREGRVTSGTPSTKGADKVSTTVTKFEQTINVLSPDGYAFDKFEGSGTASYVAVFFDDKKVDMIEVTTAKMVCVKKAAKAGEADIMRPTELTIKITGVKDNGAGYHIQGNLIKECK